MQVAPTPQQGMAITIDDSSGLVEFTQDQPYVMETRDDKERIPFDPREVPPAGLSLHRAWVYALTLADPWLAP